MIDLSHIPLQHERPAETVRNTSAHIVHAHMGNCVMRDPGHVAYGDEHPRFGCQGGENGADELTEYLQALLDTGYLHHGGAQVLSFEVKPMPDEQPDELLSHSFQTLQDAWARVR